MKMKIKKIKLKSWAGDDKGIRKILTSKEAEELVGRIAADLLPVVQAAAPKSEFYIYKVEGTNVRAKYKIMTRDRNAIWRELRSGDISRALRSRMGR